MLGLDPGEATVDGADRELGRRLRVGMVEAEEEVKVVVAEAIEEAGISAKGSCSKGRTDVVIVVTKGALTVLPNLDGGESKEKDEAIVIGEEGREVEAGVELEGVVFGGVVGEERGGGEGGVTIGERRPKEVGFSGVEVAATRVNAVGPGGEAGGLPGKQGEGVVEEAGEEGAGDWVRWRRKRREKRVVERGQGLRGVAEERAWHSKSFIVPISCGAQHGPAQNGPRAVPGGNYFLTGHAWHDPLLNELCPVRSIFLASLVGLGCAVPGMAQCPSLQKR